MSKRLSHVAQADLLQFSGRLSKDSEAASEAIRAAGVEWQRIASNAEGLLKGPLLEAAAALRTEISTGFNDVLKRYPEAAGRVGDLTRELGELVAKVAQVKREMETLRPTPPYQPTPTELQRPRDLAQEIQMLDRSLQPKVAATREEDSTNKARRARPLGFIERESPRDRGFWRWLFGGWRR
jgi:hypothetical protein